MKIFKHKLALKKEIFNLRKLSFVPTMGTLHEGHKFLINKAKTKSEKVIVSLYVNPKQFNSKKDFVKYPRDIKRDLDILKKLKVDYLYMPNYSDIFSFKTLNKVYLEKFSKKLCGRNRRFHFKGVVNVVNRFLEIIKPTYLFLGKKDFQQFSIIRSHIRKRRINTKVVLCKTVREKNGVACSSRNKNLNKNQLKKASNIYRYLKKEKNKIKKSTKFKFDKTRIYNDLLCFGINKIDYIECINLDNLKKAQLTKDKFNIFIAYFINNVRLIDNI